MAAIRILALGHRIFWPDLTPHLRPLFCIVRRDWHRSRQRDRRGLDHTFELKTLNEAKLVSFVLIVTASEIPPTHCQCHEGLLPSRQLLNL